MMHEARLARLRFGAGKAHLGTAFHALWIFVETLGLALWHSPPHHMVADVARQATLILSEGSATNLICSSQVAYARAQGAP